MEVSFHRAFDRCIDPYQGMEDIIEAGCQRILTSGQQVTAIEGAELIKNLIVSAGNRIIVMPGSGIRKENIKALAEVTGAEEFHTSLRSTIPSFSNAESYEHPGVLEEQVKALKAELNDFKKK
jgi:copper homeostasis protein